jgi:RAB protein geranylgeranyltransferase component A
VCVVRVGVCCVRYEVCWFTRENRSMRVVISHHHVGRKNKMHVRCYPAIACTSSK